MLTDKQRKQRKTGIGGSDAAAVLDIKPLDPRKKQFKTPLHLWLEKTGRIESEDLSHIEPIIWGNLLEDDIITRYEMKTGLKVKLINHTLRHKKYPWMIANLDGVVMQEGRLVEAKTAEYSKEWGKDGTNHIPLDYLVQVQHCMEVMSSYPKFSHITCADIPVMFSRRDFRVFTVQRDLDIANHLIEKEKHFWHEYVLKDMPPQPTTREDAAYLWPNDNGEIVEASDDEAEKDLNEFKKIKSELDKLERKKREVESRLTARIGEASGIKVNNDLLTWKKMKNSTRVLRLYERE